MKKSIIWLLTIVMSITFGALLYFQIIYLEKMVKMRNAQFTETVSRCLNSTSEILEQNEALYFLEEDANMLESGFTSVPSNTDPNIIHFGHLSNPVFNDNNFSFDFDIDKIQKEHAIGNSFPNNISDKYRELQSTIRKQYLYQRELLNEVILTLLRESSRRPPQQRADSAFIRNYLSENLEAAGITIPFTFSLEDASGRIIYATPGFSMDEPDEAYTQLLFTHTDAPLKLQVEFPTKRSYIFSSVRFVIPTLAFSLILLAIFIFTIILAFRQKKLSEMKTDFINNMTHEFKTPISTISLAAQMLGDDSVRKSPSSLANLSKVINDETKRLRFQVEKVLQMSVFENSSASLKYVDADANLIIRNVVQTFKIKVEKFGGSIKMNLNAENAIVKVDEMHFTNIIYNLLDNAVKYMDPDKKPELIISTSDASGKLLEIRVEDNGIGLRKEDFKRIFDKFYRVHTGNLHDVKGFGLGLAYVKKMIEYFKGSISVESELGKGSTFIIILPLEFSDSEP